MNLEPAPLAPKVWFKHDGTGMPVHPETVVECLHEGGGNHYGPRLASYFLHWKYTRSSIHNVTSYRVVKEAFSDAPYLDDCGSGA